MAFFRLRAAMSLFLTLPCLPVSAVAAPAKDPYLEKRNQIINETLSALEKQWMTPDPAFEIVPVTEEWFLSISETTRLVLASNENIKISYLSLDSSRRAIATQAAAFNPVFSTSADLDRTRTPSTSDVVTLSETASYSGSVSQVLPTGATVDVGLSHSRSGRENRTYSSSGTVSVSQPLFKDFGPTVTYANLNIARTNLEIAFWDLKQQIITSVTDAQLAYWEILRTQEELRARQLSYRQSADLVEQSRRELDLGNRSYADVLQAEATTASREEAVLRAQNTLKNRQDDLRFILNVRAPGDWERPIVIADRLEADIDYLKIDAKEALAEALKNRPDYRRAFERLKNLELSLTVAKNDLLPDMTLDYSYDSNGVGNNGDSFPRVFSHNAPDWGAGLTLRVPWGLEEEIAAYHSAKNNVRAQKLTVSNLALTILRETRSALRDVETNAKRVKSAQLAYELQSKKVEAEQKRFSLGVSTSFQVLIFQADLESASVVRIGAIIDYYESIIRLWRTLGVTLERSGIVFESPRP